MTSKELKKLNRRELLEMLVEQGREVERLREELSAAQAKVSERELKIQRAGTMAEAAVAINSVYEAADQAAQQYLENLQRSSEQQQEEYARIIAGAEAEAAEIVAGAEAKKKAMIESINAYVRQINEKINALCRANPELRAQLMGKQETK